MARDMLYERTRDLVKAMLQTALAEIRLAQELDQAVGIPKSVTDDYLKLMVSVDKRQLSPELLYELLDHLRATLAEGFMLLLAKAAQEPS